MDWIMILKTIVFIIVISFAVVCGLVFIADEIYYDGKPNCSSARKRIESTDDSTKAVEV